MTLQIGKVIIIGGFLIVLLSVMTVYGPSLYALWQCHIPSYPRAVHFTTDTQIEGAFETRFTRFTTADPSPVICPFYEQHLTQQGWERVLPAPFGECFFLLRPMRSIVAIGQPVHSYIVSIDVRRGTGQQTFVQIQQIHTTLAVPEAMNLYP